MLFAGGRTHWRTHPHIFTPDSGISSHSFGRSYFMALTMIDPASSWFEIVELPLVIQLTTTMVNGKAKVSKELIFDKSSNQIARIGEYRQCQTDRGNECENKTRVDFDYKVGDKVLIRKDSILRKAESRWIKKPWTKTTVHTNGTIRIQCRTKSERINIRRVTPFSEELLI